MREEGGGASYSLVQGSRGTASVLLCLLSDSTYQPTTGTPVYIRQGDATGAVLTLFSGIVGAWKLKPISNVGDRDVLLTLAPLEKCFDDLRISPRAYFNKTVREIALDLFATVCTGVPVTLGQVDVGPRIPVKIYVWETMSEALGQLATDAGFVSYVDHNTATLQLHAPDANPSPLTISITNLLGADTEFNESNQDFRDRQIVRLSFAAAPLSGKLFAGDSTTKSFTLDFPVDSVQAASITTSTQATATGTMTGQPSPGETFSLSFQTPTGVTTRFIVAAPMNQPSNVDFSITVTAVDDTGAIITGYAGTVHFTTSGAAFDTVAADAPLTAGSGMFTFKLHDLGGPLPGPPVTALITATDTVATTTTGTSGTIVVS